MAALAVALCATGAVGMVTADLQTSLLFSVALAAESSNPLVGSLSRSARTLLFTPTKVLLVLLWALLVLSADLLPKNVERPLYGLWRLVGAPLAVWMAFRLLTFIADALLLLAVRAHSGPLLLEYLRDTLPFGVVAGSLVLAVVLSLTVLGEIFTVDLGQVIMTTSLGLTLTLALTGALRNALCSLALLSDGTLTLGDMVEVRGIAGRLVRVGAIHVQLRNADDALTTVPSADLLQYPVVNHSCADVRASSVRLRLPHGTPPATARRLVEAVPRLILRAEGVPDASASFQHASGVRGPVLSVSWTAPGPGFVAAARQRSRVLLALTAWFETQASAKNRLGM